ncbi:iron-binding protein [Campylobacter novaezeelandiae]|uniref:Iron-binding protein n=1 Tax=Campylobacter novaezeelandiae TaxID=2267891 RepID=A0A4Q9JX50_9BACT|nr:hemerythrin domain-containing protein [Campylobacter novaezeelandiae]TBR82041.1 iron-binding protein [Campylobacter novaezeelandiae]
MAGIVWCSEYSINEKSLDKQHQELFKIVDEIDDFVKKVQNNFEKEDRDNFKSIIFKLFNYIKFHFKNEEEFMEKINFPFLEEHRRVHKELTNKTKNLLLVNDIDISSVIEQLSILTKSWILNHVCTEDILINNYLTRLIYTGESHYTLEQYINLKKMIANQDIEKEYQFFYICNCDLKIHRVPQSIHEELLKEKRYFRCPSCKEVLCLKEKITNKEETFEYFKKRFGNVKINKNF